MTLLQLSCIEKVLLLQQACCTQGKRWTYDLVMRQYFKAVFELISWLC